MRPLIAIRTAEHVPMIDKNSFHLSVAQLLEDCLTIVGMPGTYIEHPGQPKILKIPHSPEAAAGENLVEPDVFSSEIKRTKTRPGFRAVPPTRCLHPASLILIEELVRD